MMPILATMSPSAQSSATRSSEPAPIRTAPARVAGRGPESAGDSAGFGTVLGSSLALRHAIHMARKLATSPLRAFLISGEAGTGKELLARCIHNAGLNADAAFVTLNCGAIPAPLLETELFGDDARRDGTRKLGALELTGRGTLFLKDIGDLPATLQPQLLRVLDEYCVPRLSSGDVSVQCRIIASTKVKLEDRVAAGAFREDLFGRLSVIRIDLPSLRDRGNDVEEIAQQLLTEHARLSALSARQLAPEALTALREHRWPGNVRELKHVIDRAMLVADGPVIGPEHLMIQQRSALASSMHPSAKFGEIRIPAEGKRLRDIEREALELTMQLTSFNQSAAARILCISRPTLARKLKAYGLAKS